MTGETTAPSQSGGSRPQASAQAAGSPVIEADTVCTPGSRAGQAGGGCRSALWGWSPPDLPADTPLKRRIDRLMPRTGWAAREPGVPAVSASITGLPAAWALACGREPPD